MYRGARLTGTKSGYSSPAERQTNKLIALLNKRYSSYLIHFVLCILLFLVAVSSDLSNPKPHRQQAVKTDQPQTEGMKR